MSTEPSRGNPIMTTIDDRVPGEPCVEQVGVVYLRRETG